MTNQLEQILYLTIAGLSLVNILNNPIDQSTTKFYQKISNQRNNAYKIMIDHERYAISRREESLELVIYSLTSKTRYLQ